MNASKVGSVSLLSLSFYFYHMSIYYAYKYMIVIESNISNNQKLMNSISQEGNLVFGKEGAVWTKAGRMGWPNSVENCERFGVATG